jgi:REP element-mobilizing transposase RayT
VAREVFIKHPEVKNYLWWWEFWSDGYYINSVWWYWNIESVMRYVQNQWRDKKTYKSMYKGKIKQQSLFE